MRRWAAALKGDVVALYCTARDPRVPWVAKVVALCVVAYAASPIDLIPDFVPVLGYLDDLVILSLGIALAVRLIPAELLAEHRAAAAQMQRLPAGRRAAIVIIGVWTLAIVVCIRWLATGLPD